ncbi:hypothetical protein [Sphingomonas rubra]|uniref:PepSY-associated TM region n=1 Tax=Sphingomonas rubra TaxID=634430 RepID=A0A1I5TY69_9SPHN|nr:hypothetical protein [Sphingomonas rubra]SFP87984.1 hypothetical protein SAMN04488241_109172 [Sphingomonas rubra]
MRRWIAVLVLALSLGVVAMVGPGVADRLFHPGRYATSGRALLPPEAYVAAARSVAPRGNRVARLALPAGDEPVIVSTAAVEVYLDPPTARVLDVRAGAGDGTQAIVGAQPLAGVIARARPYGGAAPLRGVEWPSQRHPDWTVTFGDAGAAVKVADDSGTGAAAAVRQSGVVVPSAAPLSVGVRAATLLGAIFVAAAALWWIIRRSREVKSRR